MNKKNQLPLLISVVIIVFMFVLVGISSALTLTTNREKAFRTEANKILKASVDASKRKIKTKNTAEACKIDNDRVCYTVKYLIDNDLYDGDINKYSGKVIYDSKNESYELYLKKTDEFRIIGGSSNDYNKVGILARESWQEDYTICTCN